MALTQRAQEFLKEYQRKRDFKVSPEPSGKAGKSGKKRKAKEAFFCVQKHLASSLHYDFRLEHRGVLLSWAVPKGPSLDPAIKRLAMRVEDHPFDYGQFEGVIPEGYGQGIVMLWDKGSWKPEVDDIDAALEKGDLKFTLEGKKLSGSWVLVRTGRRDETPEKQSRTWLLIKHRDANATDKNVLETKPLSVKSGGDLDDILAAKRPRQWKSHQPEKGGAAGKMLKEVVEKAAKKKARTVTSAKKRKAAPGKKKKVAARR